jgi:hypothetical protein
VVPGGDAHRRRRHRVDAVDHEVQIVDGRLAALEEVARQHREVGVGVADVCGEPGEALALLGVTPLGLAARERQLAAAERHAQVEIGELGYAQPLHISSPRWLRWWGPRVAAPQVPVLPPRRRNLLCGLAEGGIPHAEAPEPVG